jgi:diguanylate cyclase (GGDEF)-like protein
MIAGAIAVLLSVLAPAGYFFISYQYMLGTLDTQAELNANVVTSLVMANPTMWQFEQIRLAELLERRSVASVPEGRRILDRQGIIVAEHVDPMDLPIVWRHHDIYDAGVAVAKIEISRSMRPLVIETGLVAIGALFFGILVFVVLRTIPLRAVRKAHRSLQESEQRFRSIYDSMNEGLALHGLVTGPDGRVASFSVIDVNPACASIFGRQREELIGRDGGELFNGAMLEYLPEMARVVATGEPYLFELGPPAMQRSFSVSLFSPQEGLFATLLEDITERKEYEAQIQRLAYFDSLTGLPNRSLLMDRLDQALARAARESGKVAVLFIDLDRFKDINDTQGHACGDLLLIEVAKRLGSCVRSTDTLARLGGDEFVVLLSSIGEEFNVVHVAQHLLKCIVPPFAISGRDVYSSASIGIALYPEDGRSVETLLSSADMAMYAAKECGRNTFNFFSQEMNKKAHDRMELETELRLALARNDFLLEFQPIMNAEGDGIVAVEALIRWQHQRSGRVMPDQFIAAAEDSGLIVPMGEWVLRTACQKMREWRDAGLPPLRVAVNVSARQFTQSSFVSLVSGILDETGADPRYLELELTETTLMVNADATVDTLFRLKELDLSIVVDDFGAGYSSLGYLKNFPIDRLKIDRSFVRDVCNNPNDRAIVEAIIAVASRLTLEVIAEGVETREQLAFLQGQGCSEFQGYYFHRPMPEEQLRALLREAPAKAAVA